MKNKDHIFESAYWAGRMIDMPDSKMAWDIANEIASELKQERNKAIDEIQTKGMELAKILRNADPVMFPTLVIRAEAIEDFCKTLTAHGEH